MNKTDNTFSFADLVRQYKIEIPIIQRDYAQGRDNPKAVSIRKQFVTDLLNALMSDKKVQLELSFIYGRVENGVFIPIDGQQRLTTLYLLHMYLVKRCKMTRCNSCIYEDLLSRFTYATRQSAREFCEKISEPQTKLIPQVGNLIEHVHDQSWFFVEWQKDPTIEGMLRVLEEIHLLYSQMDLFVPCCGIVLARLFGAHAPIRFRFMDMEGYSQTDDLYLKMNARGLPLTALENLKCSIESYCDPEEKREKLSSEAVKFEKPDNILENDWEKMSFGKKLSRLFDGAWLDSFWGLDKNNNPANCDAIMMVFVARLFALYAIENDSFSQKSKGASEKDEYLSLVDDKLLEINGREDYLPFNWFKIVLEHGRKEPAERAGMLNRFANWMNIFSGLDKGCTARSLTPSWEKPIAWRTFLEKFSVEKAWRQYAALYAILSFFDHWETKCDETEFKEWMRVQWNIIENGAIDSFEQMQRYVKTCSRLAAKSKNKRVLEYLKSIDFQPEDKESFSVQLKEEKMKAELILDRGRKGDVEAAEKLPWFRGRISAIILDSDIDEDIKDWFSRKIVGDPNSVARVEWVKKVICCIEQQYNKTKSKKRPWIYFPVRGIINGDAALKEAIYNAGQGRWIICARDVATTTSVWLNRMDGDNGKGGWKNRVCINSYREGAVYAYRVAYITGAYRLDDKIDWWYDFVKKTCANVCSWQTNEHGTWIKCEIEEGGYKGIYALYQDETSSFVQKLMDNQEEWFPSKEIAKQMWVNSKHCWTSLLDELNKSQA